jgi:hypothetical protein
MLFDVAKLTCRTENNPIQPAKIIVSGCMFLRPAMQVLNGCAILLLGVETLADTGSGSASPPALPFLKLARLSLRSTTLTPLLGKIFPEIYDSKNLRMRHGAALR